MLRKGKQIDIPDQGKEITHGKNDDNHGNNIHQ
jgi:hypothetical protein